MIKKYWSIEEAMQAEEEALKKGANGPTTPLWQWLALHALDELEAAYKEGDEGALFAAIRQCANHDLVMPEWVSSSFIRGYDKVLSCRVRTWSEAFGKTGFEGKDLKNHRQNQHLRFKIYGEVVKLKKEHEKRPTDEWLFEEVAEKFNIKKTLANRLYYEAKRLIPGDL